MSHYNLLKKNEGESAADTRLIDMLIEKFNEFGLKECMEPALYTAKQAASKRFDIGLEMCNEYYHLSQRNLDMLFACKDLLLLSILMLDDIQDKALFRRSSPCAYTVFGEERVTVNSILLLFLCLLNFSIHKKGPKLIAEFLDLLITMGHGQALELYWREEVICPTQEQYLRMTNFKTGKAFVEACVLFEVLSPTSMPVLKEFVEKVSSSFQLFDDYSSLTNKKLMETKTFCEDISEGKFSLPIVHAIQSHPEDTRIIDIIRRRPTDYETKKRALEILKELGSLQYTRRILKNCKNEIQHSFERLPKKKKVEKVKNLFFDCIEDLAVIA